MSLGKTLKAAVEGDLLWTPGDAFKERAGLSKFAAWLEAKRGLRFRDYEEMWLWSVSDPEGFWSAIWESYSVISDVPRPKALSGDGTILGARWFEGARVNYAEPLLRFEQTA